MLFHFVDNGECFFAMKHAYLKSAAETVYFIVYTGDSATKLTKTLKKKTALVSAFLLLNVSCNGHNNNLFTQHVLGITHHKRNLNPGMKALLDKFYVTVVHMSHRSMQ